MALLERVRIPLTPHLKADLLECIYMNKFNRGFLSVPVAIVIAGLIIGISLIYAIGRNFAGSVAAAPVGDVTAKSASEPSFRNVQSVSLADHILGSPSAPIKIIEFSDPECPFCKRFHETMHKIVADNNGKVAWVYRNFPLDSLHSKARKEAEAIECAAELGGNDKFWAYLDRLFDVTPSNNGLDLHELPNIAQYVGLNVSGFTACLDSGRNAARVEKNYQDGLSTGVTGTPLSVIVKNGEPVSIIEGAYPYDVVSSAITAALK